MKHLVAFLLMLLGFGGLAVTGLVPAARAASHEAFIITIDGAIDPVSARFLSRGIDTATERGAPFVIVLLDTPGGLLDSTRDMVEKILASKIPVIVYVYPPGAQAASAGTFIAAAAHFAAMAPTTNIGAASPVGSGGEDLPDTLKSKATQDAAAFIRSIAETRGRNADALQETVLSATSYAASEAVDKNIVDFIARDLQDLLKQLDGRPVKLQDREVVLETDGVALRDIRQSPVERFLGFLANPDVAFLLLTIGGLGVLVEVLHPGLIAPGVFGVIALALAFVALGHLPVNWTGVALIALAMVLFFVEAQAPGIGIFGIGGAISFILGAFLLFGGFGPPPIPRPSVRVSLWLISLASVIMFSFLIFFFGAVRQSRRARYSSSPQTLVGKVGTAKTSLEPRGTVQIASELWSAVSDSGEPIPAGEDVIVQDVEGLTLKVFKARR